MISIYPLSGSGYPSSFEPFSKSCCCFGGLALAAGIVADSIPFRDCDCFGFALCASPFWGPIFRGDPTAFAESSPVSWAWKLFSLHMLDPYVFFFLIRLVWTLRSFGVWQIVCSISGFCPMIWLQHLNQLAFASDFVPSYSEFIRFLLSSTHRRIL